MSKPQVDETRRSGRSALIGFAVIAALGLFVGLPNTASAAGVNVKTSSKNNAIELGQATSLRITISGLTRSERESGQLVVRAARFPYRRFRSVARITAPSKRERITVSPKGNTAFQVTFKAGANITLNSTPVTVYVNPIASGGRTIDFRRGTTYSAFTLVFDRSVLGRWFKIPKRIRTVYFYQQCVGSSVYRLKAKKRVRITVGKERFRARFPGYRFTVRACDGKPFYPLAGALGKFPGYLPNGDDGVGVPDPSARLYKRWVKWAGRKRIPVRLIDPVFYR